MDVAEVAEPPAAMNQAINPKKPVTKKVTKKVVKASAAGASTPKKNLQKKTIKPTMKPSAAKEEEKLCKKPSAEVEQVEPAAMATVLSEDEACVKAWRSPLAQLMHLKVRVADRLNEMEKTLESDNPPPRPRCR